MSSSRDRAVCVIVTTALAASMTSLEDHALPCRGSRQHGMQDHDARHAQRFKQRNDVLAVGPAVDAVLVLHDRDIEAVEHVTAAAALAAEPFTRSCTTSGARLRAPGSSSYAHHSGMLAWPGEDGRTGPR